MSYKNNLYCIWGSFGFDANSINFYTLYTQKTFANRDSLYSTELGNTFVLNDSSLLQVNLAVKNYSDSTGYVRFINVSINDAQINYTAYIDRNDNAHFDREDTVFSNARVEISDSTQTSSYSLNTLGHYDYYTFPGRYISGLISYDQHLRYYDVEPVTDTSILTHRGHVDSVFFRLVPKPDIQDLQISIIPLNIARSGFTTTYKILAKNVGTAMIRNVQVKFLKDSLQTIDSVYNSPFFIADDTVVWNIDSLDVYRSNEFTVRCLNAVPPALNTGDTLNLYALITPTDNDWYLKDNTFDLQQLARNSSDPNDKTEAHGSAITLQQLSNRDYLYYTIRFQNTGNSYATNIIIKDTLASTLDWSTFEMLSASHYYTLDIQNKRNVTWTFNGIYLPDSTSYETYSHGYVSFRIKPAEGLTTDASIYNRAAILFDYNLPVFTNTVTTSIIDERPTGIKNHGIKDIRLFPNPATQNIQLEFNELSPGNLSVQITDIQGNQVHQEYIKPNAGYNVVQLNVGNLPNGIYFIQLNDDKENLYYGKMIKR